ncbi:hypothetical protein GCM10017643_25180 [Ancylobacter dichloromethanicus]|uniref:Uncharacterized protein n=1 Tax=Ancylobacter dichloromethanicus TaxID=518825 RepID=A0A9W6MZW9_9HYPH|nr:hypothetical protein GCM10017643_25180 [Ancylobacter dichloromethanicus]
MLQAKRAVKLAKFARVAAGRRVDRPPGKAVARRGRGDGPSLACGGLMNRMPPVWPAP